MRQAGTILIILLAGMIAVSSLYCQEKTDVKKVMSIYGNVDSIDWVGSVLVAGGMRFTVASDVEVFKGSDRIGFSDIKMGDTVTVKYTVDPSGSPKAFKIIVDYSGGMVV